MNKVFCTVVLTALLLLPGCSNRQADGTAEPILGIFGGMGPESTADLYRQVVNLTPAERDQDHLTGAFVFLALERSGQGGRGGGALPHRLEATLRLARCQRLEEKKPL